MRIKSYTGIPARCSPGKCRSMRLQHCRMGILKMRVSGRTIPTMFSEPTVTRNSKKRYTLITHICSRVLPVLFLREEGITILPVTVNGLDGQLFLEDDWEDERSVVTWIDPDSNLQFVLSAYLDEAGMIAIAESVSLVKTEK